VIQYGLDGLPVRAWAELSPVERPYPSGWAPRKGNFATTEDDCRTIRGVLISRLDDCFELGVKPKLVKRLKELIRMVLNGSVDGTQKEMESFVREVFQEMQAALFPEEFLTDEEAATEIRGLVPKAGQGLERVNYSAIAKLARKLEQKQYKAHAAVE